MNKPYLLAICFIFSLSFSFAQGIETTFTMNAHLKTEPNGESGNSCLVKKKKPVIILDYVGKDFWKANYDGCVGYAYKGIIEMNEELEKMKSEYFMKQKVERDKKAKLDSIKLIEDRRMDSINLAKREIIKANIISYASEGNLLVEFSAGIRIKDEPSLLGDELFYFENKVQLAVIDYFDNYFTVEHDNKQGYISEAYGPSKVGEQEEEYELLEVLKKEKNSINRIYKDSLQQAYLTDLAKKEIVILGTYVTDINSAGGVDFGIHWIYYNKKKTIKYIAFTVVPFNEVGDQVYSEVGNRSIFTGQITGPIYASSTVRNPKWGIAWYNNTVSCIKVTKVRLEYMDGTSDTYYNDLPIILDSNFSNDCSFKE